MTLWRQQLMLLVFIASLPSVALAQLGLFDDEEARAEIASIKEGVEIMRGSLRQLATQLTKLNAEKQELLGLVRELTDSIEENRRFSEITASDLSENLEKIKSNLGGELSSLKSKNSRIEKRLSRNDEKLYDQGYDYLEQNNTLESTETFRELIKLYPNSIYVPAASYHIAEAQLAIGAYQQAAETLTSALNAFPASTRAPESMLLLAQIHEYQNNLNTAIQLRRQVIEKYPTTYAADQARKLVE